MSNKNHLKNSPPAKGEYAEGGRGLVPKLRFPEFRDTGEWEEKRLGDVSDVRDGTHDSPKFFSEGRPLVTSKNLLRDGTLDLSNVSLICEEDYEQVNKRSKVTIGDILFGMIGTIGNPVLIQSDEFAIKNVALIKQKNELLNRYLVQLLQSQYIAEKFSVLNTGNSQKFIALGQIRNLSITVPSLPEQQKIADCLSSLDELISAQTQKLATLKTHKKGLMQQLFPGEGETLPKLRFPEFRDAGEWEEKTLDKCLDYQQPTAYLVSDTKYSDAYKTPVLTAGKTFILGYTNEQHGIFSDNLPVIIFDDFTTATQFVDFPFKAKSSAMKILQAKNGVNIKFMYEIMRMIAYEVGVHERHWISKFAPMSILVPYPEEQQKIADCLSSLDELISAQTQKLATLKTHKKGLMQQLFPALDEVTT